MAHWLKCGAAAEAKAEADRKVRYQLWHLSFRALWGTNALFNPYFGQIDSIVLQDWSCSDGEASGHR
jgi:hypothetical protein